MVRGAHLERKERLSVLPTQAGVGNGTREQGLRGLSLGLFFLVPVIRVR